MPSITKKEFVDIVREIKDAVADGRDLLGDGTHIEDALIMLSDDLGYMQKLIELVPEEALAGLEADPEGTFW